MLVERFQSVVKADYHQFHIAPLQSDSIPKHPAKPSLPQLTSVPGPDLRPRRRDIEYDGPLVGSPVEDCLI